MEINNNDGKPKILAYYLPQFYPCEFNNKWYGEGFTEWTNVGKAKPLFKNHYQPHVPADLGYYDLRMPEVAEKQVQLAQEAGIFGFCYWHYWFGHGQKLLNMPAERMLNTGKPDFPFCFAWANESWYKKLWNSDKSNDQLIMKQEYPGITDYKEHFYYCLPFFKDKKYLTFNGRPLFYIYHPEEINNLGEFISTWNKLIKEEGIASSFYFVGFEHIKLSSYKKIKDMGLDGVTFQIAAYRNLKSTNFMNRFITRCKLSYNILTKGIANLIDYNDIISKAWSREYDTKEDVFPLLMCRWDHSPRSGKKGTIYINDTPENWSKMVTKVLDGVKDKQNKVIMLKSWNEWGEGNYMEPDLKYGKSYIEILGKSVNKNKV